MGKLIVIEGSTGSGKSNQSTRLTERLKNLNLNVKRVSFPNYESESSALIKMFLRGDFSSDLLNVNSYAVSLFYTLDRFSSFIINWKEFYDKPDSIVIADSYSYSNIAYQIAKIKNKKDKLRFINWIKKIEFNKLGLPVPDLTIFLDVNPKISSLLRRLRGRDEIIESDKIYLNKIYDSYLELAKLFNWFKIDCSLDNNFPKSIIDIENEIFTLVEEHILINLINKNE